MKSFVKEAPEAPSAPELLQPAPEVVLVEELRVLKPRPQHRLVPRLRSARPPAPAHSLSDSSNIHIPRLRSARRPPAHSLSDSSNIHMHSAICTLQYALGRRTSSARSFLSTVPSRRHSASQPWQAQPESTSKAAAAAAAAASRAVAAEKAFVDSFAVKV